MNAKFVKNSVINARIDPKVVMRIYPYSKLLDGTTAPQQPAFINLIYG